MHSADLTVVAGRPTDEELAALVGVLRALARVSTPPAAPVESVWARSARPGYTPTWQRSALPR